MKKIVFLLMIVCLLILPGCWDLRELNDLGLVTAVGIDKAESPNKYSVTVQIPNPGALGSNYTSGEPQSTTWVGTQQGVSIFDAVRNLANISSKRIMWAHNNAIIIGESLAKEGIIPVVDFFMHNPELRMKTMVFISKGDAKEYLISKTGMEDPSGLSFSQMTNYRSLVGTSVESDMLRLSTDLQTKSFQPLVSAISLKKSVLEPSTEEQNKQTAYETVTLSGTAVFHKDKMLGWLTPEETRGVTWVLNQTNNTVVTVFNPKDENKGVVVEIKNSKSKISTTVKNGTPSIRINISGKGNIVEQDASTNQNIAELKATAEELVNKKLVDEIRLSLNKVQNEYKSDVFRFSKIIHVQNNQAWEDTVKYNWEKLFPETSIEVTAHIDITSSALNEEPFKVE